MVCAHAITRNRRTTRNGHTHRFSHRWNSIWIMDMAKTLVIGAYVCVVCCWSGGETFYSGAAQISEWESQGVYASHVCAPGLAIDQSKQRAPMTNGHVCTANNNPQSTIIIANNNINDIHINFSFSLSTHTHTFAACFSCRIGGQQTSTQYVSCAWPPARHTFHTSILLARARLLFRVDLAFQYHLEKEEEETEKNTNRHEQSTKCPLIRAPHTHTLYTYFYIAYRSKKQKATTNKIILYVQKKYEYMVY